MIKPNTAIFKYFSWKRLAAIIIKEFIQLLRDRGTLAIIVGIPIMQLILFGYAINTNPKHLPTVIIAKDHSDFTRTFIAGLQNTDYFKIMGEAKNEAAAKYLLATNQTQFVITIPTDFTHKLLRGERPQLLIDADATDPVATGSALAAIKTLPQTIFNPLLTGNLQYLQNTAPAIDLVTHANYNPENITQYNVVPGLLGVVLTITLVMVAAACITKEREKGTLENVLSTPARPLEVMLGKITPHIIIGYIQTLIILIAAIVLFAVPIEGNVFLLILSTLPFIAANLSVGIAFSSIASTQLQASQASAFFFLPSLLLSGFMFPFPGMPLWARCIGEVLPLTHFVRITRGIMLKGNGFIEIWPDVWPILLFMVIMMFIGLKRYRQTLD